MHLQASLWKLVAQARDLSETLRRVETLLADRLQIRELGLCRIDQAERALSWLNSPSSPRLSRARKIPASDYDSIVMTCVRRKELSPELIARVFPAADAAPENAGSTVVLGLSGSAWIGLLVLAFPTSHARELEKRDGDETLHALKESLTTLLDNHFRWERIQSERESAEAERNLFMRKLGKTGDSQALIGADGDLRDVMERIELVSSTDLPVLLLGETGSGKEVIARAIHEKSRRTSSPFIRVNCGAIPSELIDSELFGHEKGSFTGASALKRGWFERADGGTLLLDEIGEMPEAAQVRLLRVLQDGTFHRVGGERQIRADVRIVAATHRDLESMSRLGGFRSDLWYRISTFPIRIPPLRERLRDLEELVSHFVRRASLRFGLAEPRVLPQDIALLARYDWPGNIRELAAVMDRAVLLGKGARLETALALGANPSVAAVASAPQGAPQIAAAANSVPKTEKEPADLDTAMRQHIESVLTKSHGRIEGPFGAAQALGINPHTLRSRMRKLGIDWARFKERAPSHSSSALQHRI